MTLPLPTTPESRAAMAEAMMHWIRAIEATGLVLDHVGADTHAAAFASFRKLPNAEKISIVIQISAFLMDRLTNGPEPRH